MISNEKTKKYISCSFVVADNQNGMVEFSFNALRIAEDLCDFCLNSKVTEKKEYIPTYLMNTNHSHLKTPSFVLALELKIHQIAFIEYNKCN